MVPTLIFPFVGAANLKSIWNVPPAVNVPLPKLMLPEAGVLDVQVLAEPGVISTIVPLVWVTCVPDVSYTATLTELAVVTELLSSIVIGVELLQALKSFGTGTWIQIS